MTDQPTKLRVAVIGCGIVSIKHLRAIIKLEDRFELVALADSNPSAPGALLKSLKIDDAKSAKIFPKLKLFTDYIEMLETLHPDVVAITVPSGLHFQMAKRCLESGSHVLLEKPMTMKVSEAKELVDIARSTDRRIAMGHIYRYIPLVADIQNDLATGVFGTITHGSVIVRWGHDQKYYDQAAWRGTWQFDGGALMNQSIHAIDLMYWLMNDAPISVSGVIARRSRDIEAEDLGMAVFEMRNGALCQIEGTTATSPKDHEARFFVNAEKGQVRVALRKGRPALEIRNAAGRNMTMRYLVRALKRYGNSFLTRATNPHYGIYDDLSGAIRDGRNPIADAASGYQSVQAVLGIYASAKLEQKIALPLTGDESTLDMTGFFK